MAEAIETSARPIHSAGFLVIGSRERAIDRRTRLGEEFRAALGDVGAVLQADAELAVDRDHRFVAEAHARLQRRLVAAHEVGPLVAVEADAVAGPVGKARHLVVGTEAGVGDHLASRSIDRFTRYARPGGVERRRLRAMLEIPDV